MGQPPGDKQFLQSHHLTAFELIKAYWQSSERLTAYLFLIAITLMTMTMVALDVGLTYWANYFYNALQAYDKQKVLIFVGVFCVLASANVVVAVYRYYTAQVFGLRWRRWLTKRFIDRWLTARSYYYLENFDPHTDNPDQRIQDDIGSLATQSIELFTGITSSVTTFFAFIYVLWQLSGSITLSLGVFGVLHIHGYLVWVSLLYSSIGTYLTFKIGHPLVGLNFEQQRREATFRFAAVDLRSHSEHIALYRGEPHQQGVLERLFARVLQNWYFIILRQRLLLWFTAGFNQTSVILPLLVALPNYFNKVFMLGGLIQSIRAFTSIQEALSYLINAYTTIAQWQAVTGRLTTFVNHMRLMDQKALKQNQLVYTQHKEDAIVASNLSIFTPQDKKLLENVNAEMVHGSHYLIKGPSGIGKTTFVRILAGIWPFGTGEIGLPSNKRIMYLPQRAYMPLGTLSQALRFPDKQTKSNNKKLAKILQTCHLPHLIPRLEETAIWSEQLSPGELQRVAFARVLLHKPDWVFLDESTSMLDLPNEEYIYNMLRRELPHCSLVSIGHRPTLHAFHDKVIDLSHYVVA